MIFLRSAIVTQKHPRLRGEDEALELERLAKIGNTPACAGKTEEEGDIDAASGKHPRLRGEDAAVFELSGSHLRNTPACAGKTGFVECG